MAWIAQFDNLVLCWTIISNRFRSFTFNPLVYRKKGNNRIYKRSQKNNDNSSTDWRSALYQCIISTLHLIQFNPHFGQVIVHIFLMNKVKPREVKNYKMCIANMYSQIHIKLFHEANCIQPLLYLVSFMCSVFFYLPITLFGG